jgi:hypothetical protein
MSVNESWRTIFNVELERRETYGAQLPDFERHKRDLLDILRKVHGGGPKKSEPFDGVDAWHALVRCATWYFKRSIAEHKRLLPARRVERLLDLASALDRARRLTDNARQDHVGVDLFRGWCAEANIPVDSKQIMNDDGESAVLDEITAAVACLTTLEAAARRAARDIPTKAGPPRGTGILSMDDIAGLIAIYRRSTGLKPDIGAGPFAQLVEEFLIAVGRGDDTSEDYVVETLKYARRQLRKHEGR